MWIRWKLVRYDPFADEAAVVAKWMLFQAYGGWTVVLLREWELKKFSGMYGVWIWTPAS